MCRAECWDAIAVLVNEAAAAAAMVTTVELLEPRYGAAARLRRGTPPRGTPGVCIFMTREHRQAAFERHARGARCPKYLGRAEVGVGDHNGGKTTVLATRYKLLKYRCISFKESS